MAILQASIDRSNTGNIIGNDFKKSCNTLLIYLQPFPLQSYGVSAASLSSAKEASLISLNGRQSYDPQGGRKQVELPGLPCDVEQR